MDISVISRVHNCADTIEELCERVEKVMETIDKSYEIILVNDFSTDDSWQVITKLHKKDPHVKGINLTRHFGESAALQAAFDMARGNLVFTISPTLENHPEELPKLIKLMEENDLDLVVGYRKNRLKGRRGAWIISSLLSLVMSMSAGYRFKDITSPLRLVKRSILQKIKLYGEHHKFLPALIAMYGGKFGEVEVAHVQPKNKKYIKPKHGFFQTLLDILSIKFIVALSTPPFRTTPIRIFGRIGILFLILGFALGFYLSYLKIFLGQSIGTRPALQLAVLLLMTGWFSLGLGLLGEMIIRIYFSDDRKMSYHAKEVLQ